MPSHKPKVQILLKQEYHDKFKALCEKERRSDSVMGAIMIETYIDNYEKKNGEITLKSSKEIWNEQMELIKNPTKGILKKSLNNGNRYGDALGREVVEKIKGKQETENQPLD